MIKSGNAALAEKGELLKFPILDISHRDSINFFNQVLVASCNICRSLFSSTMLSKACKHTAGLQTMLKRIEVLLSRQRALQSHSSCRRFASAVQTGAVQDKRLSGRSEAVHSHGSGTLFSDSTGAEYKSPESRLRRVQKDIYSACVMNFRHEEFLQKDSDHDCASTLLFILFKTFAQFS